MDTHSSKAPFQPPVMRHKTAKTVTAVLMYILLVTVVVAIGLGVAYSNQDSRGPLPSVNNPLSRQPASNPLKIQELFGDSAWTKEVTKQLKRYTTPLKVVHLGDPTGTTMKALWDGKREKVRGWIDAYFTELGQQTLLEPYRQIFEETLLSIFQPLGGGGNFFELNLARALAEKRENPVTYALGLNRTLDIGLREFNFFPSVIYRILFPNLTELHLYTLVVQQGFTDLNVLTNLTILVLMGVYLPSIPDLRGMNALELLNIDLCPELSKVIFIGYDGRRIFLPKMRVFSLDTYDPEPDVKSLHLAMPYLTTLRVPGAKAKLAAGWLSGYAAIGRAPKIQPIGASEIRGGCSSV